MRVCQLAKTENIEEFLYSQLEEFLPHLDSAESSGTKYQQLYQPCLGNNRCGNSSGTAPGPSKLGESLSSLCL